MAQNDPFRPFGVTKASQLRTKSDQWYRDVEFVYESKRYAAALYLGGFVIECLLKAALWSRRFDESVRDLLFSHDLAALLAANRDLDHAIRADRLGVHAEFVKLSSWTVRFRYNPRSVRSEDARYFMRRLREVRRWLRNRV